MHIHGVGGAQSANSLERLEHVDDAFLILILHVFLPCFDVFVSIEFALLIELVR